MGAPRAFRFGVPDFNIREERVQEMGGGNTKIYERSLLGMVPEHFAGSLREWALFRMR